jgi:hypothetical protein
VIGTARFRYGFSSFCRAMKLLPSTPSGAIIGAPTKGGAA